MANILPIPRKRRTREHVIADRSVNCVERFIFEVGFAVRRMTADYGYDLAMLTFDENGYVEPSHVYFQIKASDKIKEIAAGTHCVFSIDIADYNLWTGEDVPVFLILYDAKKRCAYWLDIQQHFDENQSQRPRASAATVRLRVPKKNRVNAGMIRMARQRKMAAPRRTRRGDSSHEQ